MMRMTEKLLARSEQGRGLRERKRLSAMTRIQEVAVDLFEERGFAHVTVEEIAEAAEVSPSSIYRYFGTKEGIVVRDEHDEVLIASLPALLADRDPYAAVLDALGLIAEEHFVEDLDLTLRRTELWLTEPALAEAGHAVAEDIARRCTAILLEAQPEKYDQLTAAVTVSSIVWGLVAAIRIWHANGAEEDMLEVVTRAVETLRDGGSAPSSS